MIPISHQGYWLTPSEKNTITAFRRSFSQGFGTEIEVRNFCGELIISHDIPSKKNISLEEFLKVFISYDHTLPLILNIKSEEISGVINDFLNFYKVENYLCCGMTMPDTIFYLENDMNFLIRHNAFEAGNEIINYATGLWLDNFNANYLTHDNVVKYLELGKKVCIASPELYRKNEIEIWNEIKSLPRSNFISDQLMLCTDKIEKVVDFFCEIK